MHATRRFALSLGFAAIGLTVDAAAQCSGNAANLFIPFANDGTWTAVPRGDDNSTGQITMPFTFTLYGLPYTRVFVNNNGNLTFNEAYGTFTASGFPSADAPPMVAPYWADVDTRPGASGQAWYKFIGANTMVVTWDNVGYYNQQTNLRNTFQVAISDGSNASFGPGNNCVMSYDNMCWTTGSASGGVGGFGGTAATVGANAGDGTAFFQVGRFSQNNANYDGPFNLDDGVAYLNGRRFFVYVGSSNVPPIPTGVPSNNTYTVNAGATLDQSIQFLSPEEGQTVEVTISDLSGAVAAGLVATTTPGPTANLRLQWTPPCCAQGPYDVDVIATDSLGAVTAIRLRININCPGFVRPVASAGGPYNAECQGPVTLVPLDATAVDPDTDPSQLTYAWSVNTPGLTFDDPSSPQPVLRVPRPSQGCLTTATVTVVVNDGTCPSLPASATVTVDDTTSPTLTPPPDISIVGTVVARAIQSSVSAGQPSVTESCAGDANFTGTRSDGRSLASPYFYGTTTVNWRALDGCNPDGTASQSVEVTAPPLPDLIIASPTAAPLGLTEERFEIAWTIQNAGAAAPVLNWTDRVFLSSDDQPGSDVALGSFTSPSLIAPGAQYTRAESFTFPVAPGMYWIVIHTDINQDVVELAGDANNVVVIGPIDVRQAPKPDLTLASVTPPSSGVVSGSNTEVSFRVRNAGTGATTSAGWSDIVLLLPSPSLGGVIDSARVLASAGNPAYLPAGDEYVQTVSVRLPSDIEGTYYIAVYTDGDRGGAVNGQFRVRELNESNNLLISGPFQIAVERQPDLQVTSVVRPSIAFSDTEAQLSWTVTNVAGDPPRGGATDIASWPDSLWLSLNNTPSITGGDLRLQITRGYSSTTGPGGVPLQPGQGASASAFVRIPAQLAGLYFVKVIADDQNRISEFGFESNNIGVSTSPIDIRLSPPVDLIPTSLTGPATAIPAHLLTIGWSAENDGAPPAAFSFSWNDRIYLSADMTVDASDTLLLTESRSTSGSTGSITLPPYTLSRSIRMPASVAPGVYHLIVVVDATNNVAEGAIGESNNALVRSQPLVVEDRAANLAITPSGVPPTSGASGTTIPLAWSVSNGGNAPTPVTSWVDRVYLSLDQTLDGSDRVMATSSHTGTLASAASYPASATGAVPLVADGNYYLLFVTDADGGVYEGSGGEANNIAAAPFAVTGGAADLNVASIVAPDTGVAGQPIAFSFTVSNIGPRATNVTSWVDDVFLSPTGLSGGTQVFARTHTSRLEASDSYVVTGSFVVPVGSSGVYTLYVRSDSQGQVFEILESNNVVAAPATIQITPGDAPNLAVAGVTAPPTAVSGQTLTIGWTVENRGGAATPTGSWRDSVYLSRDQFLDTASDSHLGTFSRSSGVAAGGSYALNQQVAIPSGSSGPYFIIVQTDSGAAVYEGGAEADNTRTSDALLEVTLPQPSDLTVAAVTPPSTAVLGQTAFYQWSIANSGTNNVTGAWKDSLFLSTDAAWSIDDKRVGSFNTAATNLTPGGSAASSGNGPTPPTVPGTYYVVTRADVFNQVPETDETNNIGTSTATVEVTAIPLTLGTPFTGPMQSGGSLYFQLATPDAETVRITLQHPSPGAFTELYVRFGAVPTTGEFDYVYDLPGSSRQEVVIPTTQAGNYYLLAKVGGSAPAAPISLLASILPFSVVSVGPAEAGNLGDATLRLRGARFTDQTTAAVISPTGQRIEATRVLFRDSANIMATFPLSGAPAGIYDVEVFESHLDAVIDEQTGDASIVNFVTAQAQTDNLLEVVAGGGPQLQLDYGLPAAARLGANFPITIVVRNEGNNDLPAPMIGLQSPNATPIHLGSGGVTANDVDDIQLVVLGRESFKDILRPGESVVFRATALAVRVPDSLIAAADLTSNPGVIPWDEFKDELQIVPGGPLWEQTWTNFKAMVGTTWADYGRALRSVATEVIFDPSQPVHVADMISILLNQALAATQPLPPPFSTRNGAPPADCDHTAGTNDGCAPCNPKPTPAEVQSDINAVNRWAAISGPYVRDAVPKWLAGSGSFTESGTWRADGSTSCSGTNCASKDLTTNGTAAGKWRTVMNQAVSAIQSQADSIAQGLSCGGTTSRTLASLVPGATFNYPSIDFGYLDFGLASLIGNASFDFSGEIEIKLECDNCTQCPKRLVLKGRVNLHVHDCYDFCPGGIPPGGGAFKRLEQCGNAAGIPVDITATLTDIPLSSVSVSSSASNDPCCRPNRPPVRPSCGQTATDPCADCRRGRQIQGPPCPPPRPVPTVVSRDPNEKAGPVGFGVERWISSTGAISYHIDFENVAAASAPAAVVRVDDVLDANLNPGTFRLGQMQVGDRPIPVPENLISWSTTVDLTATRGVLLRIDAGVDAGSNPPQAFWIFQSIDPATGEPPVNGLIGFLPPNDSTGRGTGFVEFTIRPRRTAPTGTMISNEAEIFFDNNAPIDTNSVFNTIDNEAPISVVSSAPAAAESSIALTFDASDPANGSGLAGVQLFVSDNGGPYQAAADVPPGAAFVYEGAVGHVYRFATRATDNAGNAELLPAEPGATTVVPALDMAAASDSGVAGDRVTNDRTPSFDLVGFPETASSVTITGPTTRNLTTGTNATGAGVATVPDDAPLPDGLYTATFDVGGVLRAVPFTVDGTPPAVALLESAATHGAAGEGTLAISTASLYTEARAAGASRLLVQFVGQEAVLGLDGPVTLLLEGVSASGQAVDLSGIARSVNFRQPTGTFEIGFSPALPDNARYCLTFLNITDLAGNPLPAASSRVSFATLKGDATGDARINSTDVGAVNSLVGANPINPADPNHLRADLDNNGRIDAADVQIALANRRKDVRFIPPVCPEGLVQPVLTEDELLAATIRPRQGVPFRNGDYVLSLTGLSPVDDRTLQTIKQKTFNIHGDSAATVVTDSGESHAMIRYSTGEVRDLGTLGGGFSVATAINDAGQVAGYSQTATGQVHAFRWSPASGMRDLGVIFGESSQAFGLNELGAVAGISTASADESVPFLFADEPAMESLGSLGGGWGVGLDLNDSLVVVGTASTIERREHALLWRPEVGLVDLNQMLAVGSGWELTSADVIADTGDIYGRGSFRGVPQAFRLGLTLEPWCPVDIDRSGIVSSNDIFEFLALYFAGDPRADFNRSGAADAGDLFSFLNAFFEGCE